MTGGVTAALGIRADSNLLIGWYGEDGNFLSHIDDSLLTTSSIDIVCPGCVCRFYRSMATKSLVSSQCIADKVVAGPAAVDMMVSPFVTSVEGARKIK